ncbi:MAG: stalk domain-containing protein [Proteocatella sp.]
MKRDIKKIMALMLAGSLMVFPVTASAEKGGNSGKDAKTSVENNIDLIDSKEDMAKVEIISGVVQSVNEDEIMVNTTELGLGRFLADSNVNIQDQDGEKITIKDLKAGMTLEIKGNFSVVGMSMPAYYGGTTEISVKLDKVIPEVVEDVKYISSQGEVTEVADNKITVKQDGSIKVFNLETIIIGTKDGEIIAGSKIEAGDKVTALYTSNTPMTASEPGQLTPMMIILHNGDASLKIDRFDKNLVSSDGSLRLVVDEDTKIEALKTKNILTPEDLKDRDLVVMYGATTRSIPAQTLTAGIVKIIVLPIIEKDDSKDDVNSNDNSNITNKGNKATAHQKIAISKMAKSMGYKVNWNPKTKVVFLSKGGDAIEIFVGTTRYRVNGIEKRASVSNNLDNGSTYVSSEILDVLKK